MAEAPRVRPAEDADIPAILEIVNHAIAHSTAMYEYSRRDLAQQHAWLAEKRAGGWPVLVAPGAEGGVAGFGSLGPFRPRACYAKTAEHSVYVAEAQRGQGYGRAVLEALIDAARAGGFHVLIGGVDSENAASLAFHRALGFAEAGRMREVGWKFERWLTLVFMHKIL